MNLLFRVLFSQHCRNTHHKMALDALCHLRCKHAESWQELFLKHHTPYLNGSKAPDTQFKDFRNHVVHVRDNHWGGAPQAARRWYDQTVGFLARRDWTNACYSAGVLSHYYMDPIQPFHTGQSEEETKIHRAAEWSINKAYQDLRAIAQAGTGVDDVELPHGEGWLEAAVRQGAEKANAHYETLIERYDFRKGVSDPPSGLDTTSREILAELTSYATIGFARVLERALHDGQAEPPDVNLTLHTYLATVEVPIQWVVGRMADAEERATVRAIYDEIQATGKLSANLPEESRAVRAAFAEEKSFPAIRPSSSPAAKPAGQEPTEQRPAARYSAAPVDAQSRDDDENENIALPLARTTAPAPQPRKPAAQESSELRFYLEFDDEIEAAPSIGAKTARRLTRIGLRTVADLLDADATQVAAKMNSKWITAELVGDWQDQTRLACRIPQIRGHDAQFLVATGYRDVEAVAAADAADILEAVSELLETSAGQRILRGGTAPDSAEISNWISWARQARRLQAA
ncbi:MAG: DUF4332 domain-containing protein [Planctomycetales bacterium]|nr:DUF4332 domain-containing protein [Planctomycetales bacterium]